MKIILPQIRVDLPIIAHANRVGNRESWEVAADACEESGFLEEAILIRSEAAKTKYILPSDCEVDSGEWFTCKYTEYSDYSGCLVQASNIRVFCAMFPRGEEKWWRVRYGSHGTVQLLVRTLAYRLSSDVREFFDRLDGYPLADEDDFSSLETETEEKAWTEYGESDFIRECESRGIDPTDNPRAFFWSLCEADNSGEYFRNEVGTEITWYFDRLLDLT